VELQWLMLILLRRLLLLLVVAVNVSSARSHSLRCARTRGRRERISHIADTNRSWRQGRRAEHVDGLTA
jgi:hypothetical protein